MELVQLEEVKVLLLVLQEGQAIALVKEDLAVLVQDITQEAEVVAFPVVMEVVTALMHKEGGVFPFLHLMKFDC